MLRYLYVLFASVLVTHFHCVTSTIEPGDMTWTPTENGIDFSIVQNDVEVLSGTIGVGRNALQNPCQRESTCEIGDASLTASYTSDGFSFKWLSTNKDSVLMDCLNLPNHEWYGGPERILQDWPIQKMTLTQDIPYVSRRADNFGIAERYWLNSKGAYIYLDEKNPLFISQNEAELSEGKVCFISRLANPYVNRTRNILEYNLHILPDSQLAHSHAVEKYLGRPTGHPSIEMIKKPIWSTWARYKRYVSDQAVLEFANSIYAQGFGGRIEIDDNWEKCYGAQEFDGDKFSDISNTVKQLKELNYSVSLWLHPFVNDDCQEVANEGLENGYFVINPNNSTNASWWNGDNAHQIDFTNKDAAEWYAARVRKLHNSPGIDTFKFDAGETDYGDPPSLYPNVVDQELIPNILTSSYVRTCSEFGNDIEVRSGFKTQDLPSFVRMLDKDTTWGLDNGLASLIITLLQMNLNGYTLVLPDMIGGNGYNGQLPTPELMVRWAQANVFMPTMQFSYLPWEITSDEVDAKTIIADCIALHESYSDLIIDAMENSITDGTPVNPPIWWWDASNPTALAVNDEFLLGTSVLVAPVVEEGARSRSVVLPAGKWRDGQDGTIYEGPLTIDNYPAPIEVLPHFFRV